MSNTFQRRGLLWRVRPPYVGHHPLIVLEVPRVEAVQSFFEGLPMGIVELGILGKRNLLVLWFGQTLCNFLYITDSLECK